MHKIIGILIGLIFIVIFTGNTNWFPEFFQVKDLISDPNSTYIPPKASTGIFACYLTSVFSVYFIMFPVHAADLISPKSSITNSPVLSRSIFLIFGYFLVGITFGILGIYKNSF